MKNPIRVTTLIENTVNTRGLLAEHGLAFYIEAGSKRILMDAGQTQILSQNAQKLGISLETLDDIVLSHGHYDHNGGLKELLPLASNARVFLHPDALNPKYTRDKDGTSRAIGMPAEIASAIRNRSSLVTWTTGVTEIYEGIFMTGQIPRTTPYEDVGGRFFLDDACTQPDPLADDQALFIESEQGINVILGCAHAGVVNTLQYIQQVTKGKPIHTVLGGMHLLAASPDRIAQTIAALRQMGVQRIGPAHCTGCAATAALWTAFPGKCFSCSTGSRLTLETDETKC